MVKSLCIAWDSGNLSQIQQYAVHAEKLLRERQKKTAEKRSKDLHRATLTMLQTAHPDERIGTDLKDEPLHNQDLFFYVDGSASRDPET
ncbi:hypothetical protein NFI96_009557, partial [Prochilodus magdalenae]